MQKSTRSIVLAVTAAFALTGPVAVGQELFRPHVDGNSLVLPWSFGTGCIEMSETLEGPWEPVHQEASPVRELRVPIRGRHGFYRVKLGDLTWPAQPLFPGSEPEPLPEPGIPMEPGQFFEHTFMHLQVMEELGGEPRFMDPPFAIELVRIWNTIEHNRMQEDDEVFQAFADQFFDVFLLASIQTLQAQDDKGGSFFSPDFDISIGGKPHDNSLYKNVKPAALKEGGLSGLTLDVTFSAPNAKDCCDGLQVIQVFWGTRRKDGKKIGVQTVKVGGTDYDAMVDGGKNSPYAAAKGSAAQPGKPYYLTPGEVKNGVSLKDGTVKIYDRPTAVKLHTEGYFETVIVCVNYKKTGKDKVLKAFKWGWTNCGKTYRSSKGDGAKDKNKLEQHNTASKEFMDVLKGGYPGYKLINE